MASILPKLELFGVNLQVIEVKKLEFDIYFHIYSWKDQILFQQKCYQQLIDSCPGPFWPVFGGNLTNSKNLQDMCKVGIFREIVEKYIMQIYA